MEDSELKGLLVKNIKLAEENNQLLLGMRRSARWAAFFRLVYWLVILGGLGVSYYFVQPYLMTVLNTYEQIQGGVNEIKKQQNNFPDIGKVFENMRSQGQ